jgi:hypothetical protein
MENLKRLSNPFLDADKVSDSEARVRHEPTSPQSCPAIISRPVALNAPLMVSRGSQTLVSSLGDDEGADCQTPMPFDHSDGVNITATSRGLTAWSDSGTSGQARHVAPSRAL